MHLVADIGNTETALGLFHPDNGDLVAQWRLSSGAPRTADEFDHLVHALLARRGYSPDQVDRCVLGIDDDEIERETRQELRRRWIGERKPRPQAGAT